MKQKSTKAIDVSEALTEAFYESEDLAKEILKHMAGSSYRPATVAFAFALIDHHVANQVEGWDQLKALTKRVLDGLKKKGLFDGSDPEA